VMTQCGGRIASNCFTTPESLGVTAFKVRGL
jgi:hypothetical protein